jgi:hypothetical protein
MVTGFHTLEVVLGSEHEKKKIHRPMVYKNRMRRILGPGREELTCVWRKLNNEQMRWAGHVTRKGEMRNACKILFRNPEGK